MNFVVSLVENKCFFYWVLIVHWQEGLLLGRVISKVTDRITDSDVRHVKEDFITREYLVPI